MAKKKIPELKPFYEYNIDYDTRTIYYGKFDDIDVAMVNDWSTEQVIKGLFVLDNNSHKQITIIFNSHGGDWDAGIAVFEFIRTLKSPVKMICHSRCRSMGSIILQACKVRVLSENCRFMIHYGTEGVEEVHSKNFERAAKESKVLNDTMEKIYLKRIREKHPNFTLKKFRELIKYDYYMNAKEAVELGLADKII